MAALLALSGEQRGLAALAGGTPIVNSASATYADANDRQYQTVSNAVQATVAQIAALVVGPKQPAVDPKTDGVPSGRPAVRTFSIANTSNIADAYKIVSVDAGANKILSLAFVLPDGTVLPAQIGQTVSPAVPAGGRIEVRVTVDTSALAVGAAQQIALVAQTTVTGVVNGAQSDSGTQWMLGATSSNLTGPNGSGRVQKTVDHAASIQSQPGTSVTFDILADNAGGTPATNVVVTDDVPAGLTPDVSSVTIDGAPAPPGAASVNGQRVTVNAGTVGAGNTLDVAFRCTVADGMPLGSTSVNLASISVNGGPPDATSPASVFAGKANVVFDGYGGAAHPIAGAVVTLLDAQRNPVAGPAGSSAARSAQSDVKDAAAFQNPIVTSAAGQFGFPIQASAIAAGGSTFYLTVKAPGYLNRDIEMRVTPSSNAGLYTVVSTSSDGQPLATAGGYTLTNDNVRLTDVFGMVGNVPLFSARTIALTKTADKETVQPGDRLAFTLDFSDGSTQTLGAARVVDVLPPGLAYATGSATLDGNAAEPAIDGRTLVWTLPSLAPGKTHEIRYATVVFPTAAAGTVLVNAASVAAAVPGTTVEAKGDATAMVRVIDGAFSPRRVITGRVFADVMRTGRFVKGDSGVPNVRVFMENGDYAITDADGRYSFPGARPGMHVLRVDPASLPATLRAFSGAPMNSTRSLERLVHGILDDGIMDDVNFALEPRQ